MLRASTSHLVLLLPVISVSGLRLIMKLSASKSAGLGLYRSKTKTAKAHLFTGIMLHAIHVETKKLLRWLTKFGSRGRKVMMSELTSVP